MYLLSIAALSRIRQQFDELAQSFRARAVHLHDDTAQMISEARGAITWRKAASKLAGGNDVQIVSRTALWKYVMGLDGSHYSTTSHEDGASV
jgi:hypothetical protein